jgi:aminoglycoside 3'-phosphotransferase-2
MNPIDEIPESWRAELAHASWTRVDENRTRSAVFRLSRPDGASLFAKSEVKDAFSELPGEEARLQWLSSAGIPCPTVIRSDFTPQRQWILMTAVEGRDVASATGLPPRRSIEIAAEALRALHRLGIEDCPFDHRIENRISVARTHLDAGLVDVTDFDHERKGRDAHDLFAELISKRPLHEDLVVTHGDASFPNFMAHNGRFTGFVDCGRLGIADRHQDLALAVRSIRYNLGPEWVSPFMECYGLDLDPSRMDFYQLLDEFF